MARDRVCCCRRCAHGALSGYGTGQVVAAAARRGCHRTFFIFSFVVFLSARVCRRGFFASQKALTAFWFSIFGNDDDANKNPERV